MSTPLSSGVAPSCFTRTVPSHQSRSRSFLASARRTVASIERAARFMGFLAGAGSAPADDLAGAGGFGTAAPDSATRDGGEPATAGGSLGLAKEVALACAG